VNYYVERRRGDRTNWTGPLDIARASNEQAAWSAAGWSAWIHPSTPAIREIVRAWEKDKRDRKKKSG
jgi:hypothetical protein